MDLSVFVVFTPAPPDSDDVSIYPEPASFSSISFTTLALSFSSLSSWPTSRWSVADLVFGLLLAMMRMILVIFDTKQIIFMIFTQE